jgi:hypothetical protein
MNNADYITLLESRIYELEQWLLFYIIRFGDFNVIREFSINDRVVLVTDRHGVTDANPLYYKYKVHGTVVNFIENDLPVKVKWDNGEWNVYDHKDLRLVGDRYIL